MTESGLSVLLVDDEAPLRRALERFLRRAGHRVRSAGSVEAGRAALEAERADVAFVDFRLPDGTGAELVRWAVENERVGAAYCMTGYASCRTAVEVMQAGCVDVLEKPFEVDVFADIIDTLRKRRAEGEGELAAWRREVAPFVVGDDPQLVEVLDTLRSIADTECTVLVTGESGTGKELVARAVHNASSRRAGPFVALNCAAIPDSMIEAELFGHAKGAFTGASGERVGRIAAAHGGTLFLDEIGDMPLAAQAKLLRVLQDRTITPVGADVPIEVDVRVVAATNRDLGAMCQADTFRGDLYFRLSVIPVHLPPLRERGGDVLLLARHFLADAVRRNRRQVTGFDASAEEALQRYRWPGNVRELAHLIERAVLLAKEPVLSAADLRLDEPPPRAQGSGQIALVGSGAVAADGDLDLRRALERVERELIDAALERSGGNRTEAAALLGVNRTTLLEKLRRQQTS